MEPVEKRSHAGWPRIAPATFAVAALVSASLAAALLAGMSLAQVEEETPVFEYTSEGAPYEEGLREETILEETTPEETAAEATEAEETDGSENTATGQSVSAPVEQYYVPPSEGVLADTGGAGIWLAGGVGLAILAVLGLMLFSSGLARGRAGVSSGGSESRRGGSRHE